jgi:hypothetical protein
MGVIKPETFGNELFWFDDLIASYNLTLSKYEINSRLRKPIEKYTYWSFLPSVRFLIKALRGDKKL